ncbi:hypothetical protein ACOMHN_004507 [Nucella lapillus]
MHTDTTQESSMPSDVSSPGLSSTSDSDPNPTHSIHDSSIPTDTEIGMTSSPKHKHNTSPKTGRGKNLRILNINFQSARKKGKHLEALIDSTDSDMIIGTETWLDDEVSSAEVIPNHLGYDVHRRDRPKVPNQKPSKPRKNDGRRRRRRRCGAYGGVFIAAKKELQLCEIEISKNIELISGALRLQNEKKATVAAFYRPPSRTDEAYTIATRLEVQQLRRKVKQGILIIGGDFNTPDIDGNTLSIAGNQYPIHVNQTLLDFVADSNMEQQVDFPTRQKKTLDLILTTHPSLKTRCKALPSVGNSDHDVVLYDTSLRPFRPKPPKRKILLWKKANVHAIRKDMEEYAQTFDIDTSKPDALETAWRGFSERVQKTIDKNVPSKTTQGRYSYPWIDTSLRRAIRRKQRAHTKARNTGKKRDQDMYKRLQQEVKDNIKKASYHYLDTVVTDDFKTNSKKLWAYVKSKGKESQETWLDEVNCTGSEPSLSHCPKSDWGIHDCDHTEDAAVICPSVSPEDDIIFLLDTGLHGTLFRMNLHTLSFTPIPMSTLYAPSSYDYDPEYGRLYLADPRLRQIVSVKFDGTDPREMRQLDSRVTTDSPIHFNRDDVYVRLNGQHMVTGGFVEVFANGQWGTICDDDWDDHDAAVVCRMIGFSQTGAKATTHSRDGHGGGLIVMDHVHCQGTETHIVDCGITQNNWAHHTCTHAQDAGVQCVVDDTVSDFLLFTDTQTGILVRMDLETYSFTGIQVPSSPNPVGLTYDPANRYVYYTEVVVNPGSQIYRVALDGGRPTLLRQLPQGSIVDSIAVDKHTNRLYYSDAGRHIIASANVDGSDERVIIRDHLDQSRAVVLDTHNRVMYWTDWGASPKIDAANYDGSNRHSVVTTNIKWPNGLQLDQAEGVLYFCDAGTHSIERVSISGQQRAALYTDSGAHFFGLALTPQHLYYSDWNRRGLMRLFRNGTGLTSAGPPSFTRINSIISSLSSP